MKRFKSIQRQLRRGNVRRNPVNGMFERRSNKRNSNDKDHKGWVLL